LLVLTCLFVRASCFDDGDCIGDVSSQLKQLNEKVDSVISAQQHMVDTQQHIVRQSLDPWNKISSSSKTSNPDRTKEVMTFYGVSSLHCHVLGRVRKEDRGHTQLTVKNAHIWPKHTGGIGLELLGLTEFVLENPRNMLRLHWAIEAQFDIKRLSFLPSHPSSLSPTDLSASQFDLSVRILDPSLLQEKIGETGKTFEDIDRHKIRFLNTNRPYSRLFYIHYRQSVISAERRGWIERAAVDDDDLRLSDQEALRHSVDSESATRIAIWLNRKPSGSPPNVKSLAEGSSSQAAVALSAGPTIGIQGSHPVAEEKTCSGEECHNIMYHKCVRKMCSKCCLKKGNGNLCEEHKKKPKK
jgi:hypothetical protein